MSKCILLITGPIGTGKTQLCKYILNNYSLEYISADIFYHLYFKKNSLTDDEAYDKAKKYYAYKLKKNQLKGASFVLETVVAKKDKIDFLVECKKQGYSIVCLFLSNDIIVLPARVNNRENEGWYNIPMSKIYDRYYKVMRNLPLLISLSDLLIAIDTTDGYTIGCVSHKGEILFEDESTVFKKIDQGETMYV